MRRFALGCVLAALPLAASAGDGSTSNRWAVDPGAPGEDLPRIGRSLFDWLITEQHLDRPVYEVPFSHIGAARAHRGTSS